MFKNTSISAVYLIRNNFTDIMHTLYNRRCCLWVRCSDRQKQLSFLCAFLDERNIINLIVVAEGPSSLTRFLRHRYKIKTVNIGR